MPARVTKARPSGSMSAAGTSRLVLIVADARAGVGAGRDWGLMQMRSCVTCLIFAVAVSQASNTSASQIPGQRIVARHTVNLLPSSIREFFEDNLDALSERTVEPDGAWRRQRQYSNRGEWHYLMLDALAQEATPEARVQAARKFPHSRTDAKNVFAESGIDDGGRLPWSLERIVQKLSRAFRSGDRDEILMLSGQVIHFCADAGSPFRCSKDFRGVAARNPVFGDARMGQRIFPHHDVAHRVDWELVRRNAHRYRMVLSRAPGERVVVDSVREACFETMIKALGDLDAMLAADAELCARLNLVDGSAFEAHVEEYYQLLDEKCSDACLDALRRGAELAAGVIVYAWQRADGDTVELAAATSPTQSKVENPVDQPAGGAEEVAPAAAPVGFVASRNSKVFHRADCPHAARISDRNLRKYDTLEAARNSGRRGCQTCRPESGG